MENPDGQNYKDKINAAGRSDVLEWSRDALAPGVQAVYADFSERYGWGDPGRGLEGRLSGPDGSDVQATLRA